MLDRLVEAGFEVESLSHAKAILTQDFPELLEELESALLGASIPIEEIIAGGGGEAKGTQRLRRALAGRGWNKMKFRVEKTINGEPRESISHEVDHARARPDGRLVVLEIEWNNKDPFFDRDLENYKRLHADGAISVGIIVTRGRMLHDGLEAMVRRFLDERGIDDLAALRPWGYEPTGRQRAAIERLTTRKVNPLPFRAAFAGSFVGDKFGESTTHWRKLVDRVRRGVGNPCPLVLIGLPPGIVTFHEGQTVLAELSDGQADDAPIA